MTHSVGVGDLRSSRGRTRTCDPVTRNRPARVLGNRKLSDWRLGNPDENPETGPNRTRPTVPTSYPAKESATRDACAAGAPYAARWFRPHSRVTSRNPLTSG